MNFGGDMVPLSFLCFLLASGETEHHLRDISNVDNFMKTREEGGMQSQGKIGQIKRNRE